jgi:hypothetical protein
MRKHPIVTTPSQRPMLNRLAAEAHGRAAERLKRLDRTWNWLALQCASNGLCAPAVINHWGAGRQAQVGCAVWLGIEAILAEEEARRERPIRIRTPKGDA